MNRENKFTQSLSQNLATRLIVNHCKALTDGSPDERCPIVQYDRMGTILQRNSKTAFSFDHLGRQRQSAVFGKVFQYNDRVGLNWKVCYFDFSQS